MYAIERESADDLALSDGVDDVGVHPLDVRFQGRERGGGLGGHDDEDERGRFRVGQELRRAFETRRDETRRDETRLVVRWTYPPHDVRRRLLRLTECTLARMKLNPTCLNSASTPSARAGPPGTCTTVLSHTSSSSDLDDVEGWTSWERAASWACKVCAGPVVAEFETDARERGMVGKETALSAFVEST